MSKFNPSPKTLVVNELIEKGYTIDYDDALRICHELEEEQQTHHKAAIGLTAVGIVGAGVTLAFCGAVAPLLVPIAAIGVGAMGAWNHPIRAARRDDEADFLRANPTLIPLIEKRLQSGEAPFKVAAAYLECFRAWRNTGQPLALPSVGNVPVDESLPAAAIATSSPVGNQTRIGAIEVSSTTAAQSGQWDEDEKPMTSTDLYEWMKDLLSYPSVLIYGAQGSGKSTFAEWLMTERSTNGHKLEILDPHREFGQWSGLEVFGDGMDYNAIDDRLEAFADLVVSRYLTRSKKADFNPCPLTVLAEEFTQWSKKCSHAAAFFETSLSDIRKINCHVVYISHGRTLTCLGGSKGLADTRDATLLELELLTKVDETTGKAVPALRGLLKYPGRSPIEVAIPVMKAPSSRPISKATPQDLERIFNQPAADHEVEEEEIEQQDTTAIDIKELFPHWNEKMISVAAKVLIHLRSKSTLKAYEIKSATAELRAADRTKTDKLLVELIAKNLVQVADGSYSAIAPSADSLDDLDW